MKPLTKKQSAVLDFLAARLARNLPPSQREIAAHFNFAKNAARQLINYLIKKDYVINVGGHRGLRLSPEYLATLKQRRGIPLVGRVAAGEPILAQQNIETYLQPDELLGYQPGCFYLTVTGDSMIDVGIFDGDYVLVQPDAAVENDQIAVVLIGEEATVKHIAIRGDQLALKPANRAARYKTKYIKRNDQNVRIIGKVIACFRKL